MRNFCVASKIKLEHYPEETTIYGITPVVISEDVKTWIKKAYVEIFILIVSKTFESISG